MAENLLCTENTNTCFDGFDCNNATNDDEFSGVSLSWRLKNSQIPKSFNNNNRSTCLMGFSFPLQSEEILREIVEKEREHLPRDDYLTRLRSGDLDLRVRREAFDWIWKAHAHYRFGSLTVCLSMNYLDRFLSVYELPRGKSWTVQLLAVACVSLAAKMEETEMPLSVELQVGEPKFVFEAKTIQRMELLVLSTLKWRMQSFTPFSFIDYFLTKINDNQHPSTVTISRSVQLILSTIKGIDFLEFRPSEIAAAVAISVSALDNEKVMSCFIHVERVKIKLDRVLKCVELIEDLSLMNGSANISVSSVPQSPYGVLEAGCFSYKSDITVGSCANSSHNKRRKQDTEPSSVDD